MSVNYLELLHKHVLVVPLKWKHNLDFQHNLFVSWQQFLGMDFLVHNHDEQRKV